MENKQKFYEKTWFILIMLVLFAPVGIFLIWKYKKFGKAARIIASIIFGLFFLFIIIPSDENDVTKINKTQNEMDDTPITPTVTPSPKPTVTPEPTASPEPTATPIPTLTPDDDVTTDDSSNDTSADNSSLSLGQLNALSKAYEYLDFTAFSHDGLVEQLEFEGFSNEEAIYAADNCGADWNEQAAKKAQEYLAYSAFSYDGLVEQLEFEGFSNEEAIYAVDNSGADWNEQAAKKAQEYLDYSAFSRSSLIEQLEYEGFTASQAENGAKAVGY